MENNKMGVEEEFYLAPETGLFEEAKRVGQKTIEDERFDFALLYDVNEREFLYKLLQSLDVDIISENENENVLNVHMNMQQLKFIKGLDCIKRVKTDEDINAELGNESDGKKKLNNTDENIAVAQVEQETEASVLSLSAASTRCVSSSGSSCCCPSNTSMCSAQEIKAESGVCGRICCPGAEQWFKFTVSETGKYTIYTTGSLDTVGVLYNCCGNWIATVDDYEPCGKLNFRIVQTLKANETYYLRVTEAKSNTGSYTLYVTKKLLVTYVSLTPSTLYLEKGTTYELPMKPGVFVNVEGTVPLVNLSVKIIPSLADEKQVLWYSSNNDVIKTKISWYNGKKYQSLTVVGSGTAKLYAFDWNGDGKRGECTVKVDTREKVVVELDSNGSNNKIVFSDGRIWNCINFDIINGYQLNQNESESQRFYDNAYEEKVVDEATENVYYYEPMKEYTDEEIKLIYMIDPYGLAAYVREYAENLPSSIDNQQVMLEKILGEKDRIFTLLFNSIPKYYARRSDGTWYQTSDRSNLNQIVSESEFIFGFHPIYDIVTLREFISVALDIINVAIKIPALSRLGNITKIIENVIKYYSLVRSVADSILDSDFNSFISAVADGLVDEDALEEDFIIPSTYKTKNYTLSWAFTLLSFSSDLNMLAETFTIGPHFYKEIFTQCANDDYFKIMFRMTDGNLVSISDINMAIN